MYWRCQDKNYWLQDVFIEVNIDARTGHVGARSIGMWPSFKNVIAEIEIVLPSAVCKVLT